VSAAVQIGPLVLPTARLAVLLGILAFLGLAAVFTRRSGSRVAWPAVLVGLIVGRMAFVLAHLPSYRDEPLTVFAVWQGGFSPVAGIAAAALLVAWKGSRERIPVLAALAAGVGIWASASAFVSSGPVRPWPRGMTVYALDGQAVPIDRFRGRPFVINLWATWCGPCRRELPMLARAAEARPSVPVLFMAQGEDAATVAGFLRERGLRPRHVLVDRSGDAGRAASSSALPTTLFVAGDGTIRDTHVGEISRAALDIGIDGLVENRS